MTNVTVTKNYVEIDGAAAFRGECSRFLVSSLQGQW